jgi:hypothetical protein
MPTTMKPVFTSVALSWVSLRAIMLRLSVTAATPTPRLTPSCCAIAAKLLARLIWSGPMSA